MNWWPILELLNKTTPSGNRAATGNTKYKMFICFSVIISHLQVLVCNYLGDNILVNTYFILE